MTDQSFTCSALIREDLESRCHVGGYGKERGQRKRTFLAVAVALVVGCLLATPALGSLTNNTFGSAGTIGAGGHHVTITVLLGCTQGGAVHFTVTLTQGETTGVGHGAGVCTGETETYTVVVTARGKTFEPGEATACGDAVNRETRGGIDTRTWCRSSPVVLA